MLTMYAEVAYISISSRDGTKGAITVAWKDRWKAVVEARQGRTPRLADLDPELTDSALRRHDDLTKAESSLLIQARIGAIGLKDFLFRVKVPRIIILYYAYSSNRETVEHLVVWCLDPPKLKTWPAIKIYLRRDFQEVM